MFYDQNKYTTAGRASVVQNGQEKTGIYDDIPDFIRITGKPIKNRLADIIVDCINKRTGEKRSFPSVKDAAEFIGVHQNVFFGAMIKAGSCNIRDFKFYCRILQL